MAGELLTEAGRRAEARSASHVAVVDVGLPPNLPRHGADTEGFDVALLEVLRGARGAFPMGELRRRVAARCAESGVRAPTQARLWRHLVALEWNGVIRREVRLGGAGGSSTHVGLVGDLPGLRPRRALSEAALAPPTRPDGRLLMVLVGQLLHPECLTKPVPIPDGTTHVPDPNLAREVESTGKEADLLRKYLYDLCEAIKKTKPTDSLAHLDGVLQGLRRVGEGLIRASVPISELTPQSYEMHPSAADLTERSSQARRRLSDIRRESVDFREETRVVITKLHLRPP